MLLTANSDAIASMQSSRLGRRFVTPFGRGGRSSYSGDASRGSRLASWAEPSDAWKWDLNTSRTTPSRPPRACTNHGIGRTCSVSPATNSATVCVFQTQSAF
jgi:hypothetical protein